MKMFYFVFEPSKHLTNDEKFIVEEAILLMAQ